MLQLVERLCQTVTKSRCNPPRWSDWSLVAPSQSGAGVDVADVVTLGGTITIPVNVTFSSNYFVTELKRHTDPVCAGLRGRGLGAGTGAGWGLTVGGKSTSKLPIRIRQQAQAFLDMLNQQWTQAALKKALETALEFGGSEGTRMVCGPDAPSGRLSVTDLEGWASIYLLSLNFMPAGASGGLVIFSKKWPVLEPSDMIYATAVGLMAGYGLSTSRSIGTAGSVHSVERV